MNNVTKIKKFVYYLVFRCSVFEGLKSPNFPSIIKKFFVSFQAANYYGNKGFMYNNIFQRLSTNIKKQMKHNFTSLNENGVSPAIVVNDVSGKGSNDNGSNARAADCNASRQGAPPLKVEAGCYDCWHVDKPKPYT